MLSLIELFQQAVQLAAYSLVRADAEDLGDLVSRQAKQPQLTGTLEQLVNREIAPKDELAAVLDLVQRVVTLPVDGGPVLVGELRPQDQGPVVQALADDLGTEAIGRRLPCLWIVRPQKGIIVLAEADTWALEFPCDEGVTVDGVGGLEREQRAGAHHHGAEHFVADMEVVMRIRGAIPSEDAVIGIAGGILGRSRTEGGTLFHALADEGHAEALATFPAGAERPDRVFFRHAFLGPLDRKVVVARVSFHPLLVLVGPLGESLFGDGVDAMHVPKKMNDMLGTREPRDRALVSIGPPPFGALA